MMKLGYAKNEAVQLRTQSVLFCTECLNYYYQHLLCTLRAYNNMIAVSIGFLVALKSAFVDLSRNVTENIQNENCTCSLIVFLCLLY